jgi:antitoxin HigA-1
MMSNSATITDDDLEIEEQLPPMHAGEVLREEFMIPLNLSSYALAKALHVPRTRIERIAREESAITTDTALRLGRYFDTGPEFWMNLQKRYELECARLNPDPSIKKIAARPSQPLAAE